MRAHVHARTHTQRETADHTKNARELPFDHSLFSLTRKKATHIFIRMPLVYFIWVTLNDGPHYDYDIYPTSMLYSRTMYSYVVI